MSVEEDAVETISGEFMAVGDHLTIGFITKDQGGTQAQDNPLGLMKMGVRFGEMSIDLFEQCFFGWTPKVGIMAEGAKEFPSYFDNLVMGERSAFL